MSIILLYVWILKVQNISFSCIDFQIVQMGVESVIGVGLDLRRVWNELTHILWYLWLNKKRLTSDIIEKQNSFKFWNICVFDVILKFTTCIYSFVGYAIYFHMFLQHWERGSKSLSKLTMIMIRSWWIFFRIFSYPIIIPINSIIVKTQTFLSIWFHIYNLYWSEV